MHPVPFFLFASRHSGPSRTVSKPPPDIAGLARLHQALDVPLVLHGSSGVADATIVAAISAGMTKINVSTHLNGFFTRAVRKCLDNDPKMVDSRKYLRAGRDALVPEAARLLTLFAAVERDVRSALKV